MEESLDNPSLMMKSSCQVLVLRDKGYTLTTQAAAVIESILTRDPYRRHQVTDVYTAFNSSGITAHSYAFDGLGRATNAVLSIQPLSLASTNVYAYNARSEVIGAGIETNDYAYFYDNIGNNLYTSLNAITNAYTVNNLNQYKGITNLVDLTGYNLRHDSDGNTTRIGEHSLYYDAENRLSFYMFGADAYMTGTVRNAYIYDHLGRRVSKMGQKYSVYAPGGITPPTYWWHTNEITTFVYDGWNLVHESTSLTNGTTQEVSYFWGKDLSGSLQGAGGVGGLLAASIDGEFYFPCYDNNGNITAYIDESGSVIAYRQYDAFGNTIAKGGSMVDTLHFWYSTKYLDHETGLYYYGYRYYSPLLQRWINRDPVEEDGGLNQYGFVENDPVKNVDAVGLKIVVDRNGKGTATVEFDCDTIEALAEKIGLSAKDYKKWLSIIKDKQPISAKAKIKKGKFLIPNTVYAYWAGEVGDFGKWNVDWDESVSYLKARGFNVIEYQHIKGSNRLLESGLGAAASRKTLHGLYFWGHGSYPRPSVGLVSPDGDKIIRYKSINLSYKMALSLIFACYSSDGKAYLYSNSTGGVWKGYSRRLVPLGTFGVDEWFKPGQQETKK